MPKERTENDRKRTEMAEKRTKNDQKRTETE